MSGDALEIKTEKKEGGAKMEWVGNHDPDMVGPGARFAIGHDPADDATDPDPDATADDDDTATKYAAVGGKMRVTIGISATSKRRKEQQEGAEAAALIRRMTAARMQSVGTSASMLRNQPPPLGAAAAADTTEGPGRSEGRARAKLKLQAIDAVKPLLDPLYKAGRLSKAGYKQTLKRAVQELIGADKDGQLQWTATQIAAAVELDDTGGTASTAAAAPALRMLSADAVITLSHVHCRPGAGAGLFRAAARWLLPRCRLREAANGQRFEHLHSRIDSALSYSYTPGNVGFEKQNVGRCPVLTVGSAVDELMWFEEWRDWSGVEKHGETGSSPMCPPRSAHALPNRLQHSAGSVRHRRRNTVVVLPDGGQTHRDRSGGR